MTKPKLVAEVSWGHIMTGITMIVMVAGLYFGIEAKLISESHARETGDVSLQQQARENTAAIQRNIEALKELQSWSIEHRTAVDPHHVKVD